MKTKITLMFILWGVICAYGQVPTKFFEKGKVFEKNSQFKKSLEKEFEKQMPAFDVSELLKEDEANKDMDIPFRFGKSFDVNLNLQDGKWEKTDSTEVWNLKITSKGAYSLNFIFSKLYLPKESELYIFNNEGSMLYGPVTEKQNQYGKKFLTDIIQGESAIIHLVTPIKSKEKPELTIQNVIHGYKNIYDYMDIGYGTSGSCNNDVACHTDWSTESDGVVQILLSTGTELCSGSMLNNTNQDYRPFILTAFHCIDIGNPTTSGEPDEKIMY